MRAGAKQIVWQSAATPPRKRTLQDKSTPCGCPKVMGRIQRGKREWKVLTFCLGDLPCESCRAKKKRCFHTEGVEGPNRPERLSRVVTLGLESNSEINTRESSLSPGHERPYNPESVLSYLTKDPPRSSGGDPIRQDSTFIEPAATVSKQMVSPEEKLKRQTIWYRRYKSRLGTPTLSEHQRAYLEEVGALLVLPKTTTDALLPLYISLLDDLIPVVDGSRVFRDLSNGEASTYLVRAMCLVICKTKQATPFLRLTDDGPLLEHRKFASKLLIGLDAALKADLEPDRVIKTQILALMHLHNDGFAGGNRSSSYLSQAICEAWSMSLHFNIAGNTDQEQCNFLWWSLRNLDRLNKPIMAAGPFIIDDTDISIDRITAKANSYRSQIMEVSTMLGDLMTTATKVYKASSKSTVDDSGVFPSLDDITSNTNFSQFHQSHRVYLELWYHITAMLSCRYSGPGAAQYDRRLASADRILRIFTQGGHENFPPLPLVPYALSMSTTVIYRALRDGQRDLAAAYEDLRSCCDALDALGQRWTSAKGVAKIAKRLCTISARASQNSQLRETTQGLPNDRYADSQVASRNSLNPITRTSVEENALVNQESILTSSLTGGEILPDEQLSSRDQLWQGQSLGPWPGAMDDPSCVPLDRAFYDLFDYSIPDVFRGPATCEFLQLVHNEDDGLDCGIQSTSPLASFSGCNDLTTNMPI